MTTTATEAPASATIRPATAEDHGAAAGLFRAFMGEGFALDPRLWTEVCTSDTHRALVAEEGGEVVGVAVVVVSDRIHLAAGSHRRRFHLDQLIVSPQHRRRGIAKKLIERVIEMAREARPSYILVSCDFTNVAARRTYEAAGLYLVRQSSDRFEIAFP